MNLIMAKMIFKYDFEMVDEGLDWHGDSRMGTEWIKPVFRVRVKSRC
jgi:hypothetical protein